MTLTYNISRQEAADILEVSTRTLDRYIRKGLISYKKVGNKVLLSKEEILQFKNKLNSNEVVYDTEVIGNSQYSSDFKESSFIDNNKSFEIKKYDEKLIQSFEKMVQLIQEKDQIIEQKNKVISQLQYRLGELETKLSNYIALPDYTKEKDKLYQEKEELIQQKYDLISQIKKYKFYNIVLILFALSSLVILIFIILAIYF